MNEIRHGFIEEQLRGKFIARIGLGICANLKVNMHHPPGVLTGIDGDELNHPIFISDLITAQPVLAGGVKASAGHI